MNQRIARKLEKLVTGKVLLNVPLSRHTTLKVGGCADIMIYPASLEELLTVVRFSTRHDLPYLVMGAGSNLLVRDGGIRGMVLKLTRSLRKATLLQPEDVEPLLQAEAGASLRRLLAVCLDKGLAGLEFVSGIPGSLGGAWAMNAGAWGREMSDVTESITLLTPGGGLEEKKSPGLPFGYRRLQLDPGTVIIKGMLRVSRTGKKTLAAVVEKMNRRRRETQPLDLPSAGSVFKNPPGAAAGRLIEQAGLKGRRAGGAQISERHANFIVNTGGATARDILALMEIARRRVYEETGIQLEPELQVVGEDG